MKPNKVKQILQNDIGQIAPFSTHTKRTQKHAVLVKTFASKTQARCKQKIRKQKGKCRTKPYKTLNNRIYRIAPCLYVKPKRNQNETKKRGIGFGFTNRKVTANLPQSYRNITTKTISSYRPKTEMRKARRTRQAHRQSAAAPPR